MRAHITWRRLTYSAKFFSKGASLISTPSNLSQLTQWKGSKTLSSVSYSPYIYAANIPLFKPTPCRLQWTTISFPRPSLKLVAWCYEEWVDAHPLIDRCDQMCITLGTVDVACILRFHYVVLKNVASPLHDWAIGMCGFYGVRHMDVREAEYGENPAVVNWIPDTKCLTFTLISFVQF